jgi:glycerophosphoryl diester phosphodiesterase
LAAVRGRPWVIGHRGCAGLRPENTLAGFRHALALGVDAVECDVHRTRDGYLAVVHDAHLDRTTNGRGAVADHRLEELRALDAGGGEPVPELGEVLDLVRGRAHAVVELKSEHSAAPAVQAVRTRGMWDQTTFISFDLDRLREVRALAPAARTGALFARSGPDTVREAVRAGASVLDVHYSALTPELAAEAHARGLAVWVWTPSTEADLRRLLALPVDGITTDRPDLLLRLLSDLS